MSILTKYLIACGLIAHIALLVVAAHFSWTGLTPHRYLQLVVEKLDRDSSPTRHVAKVLRSTLLDTGAIADPVASYPPNLQITLPRWRGIGANALRRDTAPRYTSDGKPISTEDSGLWDLVTPPDTHVVEVSTPDSLRNAIAAARAGTTILLARGRYLLDSPLALAAAGTAEKPLILRGAEGGGTIIEMRDIPAARVRGAYWTISDLTIRGNCNASACPAAVAVQKSATAFTIRNVFASGVQTLLDTPASETAPKQVLADGITLVGGRLERALPTLTRATVRKIPTHQSNERFRVLCVDAQIDPHCTDESLQEAVRHLKKDDGVLLIRHGEYAQAAMLKRSGLHIVAEPGAALRRANFGGKGALVVNASTTIEGLTCSHVKASDGNGCCVRQQQGDLTLVGVHIHHSQMGLLTGHKGGHIRIIDSHFHDSGYDESGQLGHNIYVNSGTLEFVRSWSISARNAGHELKSRAASTLILDSLIASVNARDSRLVDIPEAGILEIRGSILGEGPRSENQDVIGYGLEVRDNKPNHPINTATIRGNTIYADRPYGAQLLNEKHTTEVTFIDNVVIGNASPPAGNTHHSNRDDAGVPEYPAMPSRSF